MPFDLQAEVFLGAFLAYAAIVLAITLWNAQQASRVSARRPLGRLDEARPGGHVGHEGRAQALVDQMLGGHR